MKRFAPDLVFVVVVLALAWFLAGTPPPMQWAQPVAAKQSPKLQVAGQAAGGEAAKQEATVPGAAIASRNIFAATGRYNEMTVKEAKDPVYSLIGIISEGSRKGLFRDDTGVVTRAGRGESLADGYKVASVSGREVVLKREDRTKKMRLFDAPSPGGPEKSRQRIAAEAEEPILVGVLVGKERKALFRDAAGALTTYDRGERLPDGSVILRIDDRSVKVRINGKLRQLALHRTFPVDQRVPIAAGDASPAKPGSGRRPPAQPPRRAPHAPEPVQGGAG